MDEPPEHTNVPDRMLSNSSSIQTFITAADRTHSFDSQVHLRAPTLSHPKFPYECDIPRFFSSSFPGRRSRETERNDRKGKSIPRDHQDEHAHSSNTARGGMDMEAIQRTSSLPENAANRYSQLPSRPASIIHRLYPDDGRRFSDPSVPEAGKEDSGFEPCPLSRPQTSPAGSWTFGSRHIADKIKCGRIQGRSSTWAFEKSPLSGSPRRISGSKSRSSSGRSQASSIAPLSFNEILYPSRNQWVISETAAQKLESFSASRNAQRAGAVVGLREAAAATRPADPNRLFGYTVQMERTDSSSSSSKFSSLQNGESSSSSSSSAAHLFRQTAPVVPDRIESSEDLSLHHLNLNHTLSHSSTIIDWKGNTARQVEYAEIDKKRKSIVGWIRRYIFCGAFGGPKPFYEEGDNDNSSVRRYRIAITEETEQMVEVTDVERSNIRSEKAPATTQTLSDTQSQR